MERTYAVVLAGGRGVRLTDRMPKQFLPLGDRPLIAWSLGTFESCDEIDHILVVLPEHYIAESKHLLETHSIRKVLGMVPGGDTRQESARNALASVPFNDNDVILIHDAARPFIKKETIRSCIREARATGAAGVYVPIQDTVADIRDTFVDFVPSRDSLFYAQTPQGFRFSIINAAHAAALRDGISATDDVSLVRAAGFSVKMVLGDYSNIKITTELDYLAACRYAETVSRS